ncbi:unnamed protein product [Lactuca saligna]|uniref:valine--tRNA ligase n=1 Tax=Lactuca saligna TaxID=75948 RepID=A0AA35Z4H6_LACSI|nr:unnamed protein product [Lactuca saligna]
MELLPKDALFFQDSPQPRNQRRPSKSPQISLLLVIHKPKGINEGGNSYEYSNMTIWNPCTGDYKTLFKPNSREECYQVTVKASGLYYCASEDAYRLLRVTTGLNVYIYSLKSDSWRMLDSMKVLNSVIMDEPINLSGDEIDVSNDEIGDEMEEEVGSAPPISNRNMHKLNLSESDSKGNMLCKCKKCGTTYIAESSHGTGNLLRHKTACDLKHKSYKDVGQLLIQSNLKGTLGTRSPTFNADEFPTRSPRASAFTHLQRLQQEALGPPPSPTSSASNKKPLVPRLHPRSHSRSSRISFRPSSTVLMHKFYDLKNFSTLPSLSCKTPIALTESINPTHDPNDFEVGKRHKLEFINIFTDDGKINSNGGLGFVRMPCFEARVAITEALKSNELYKGEEKNEIRLGVCSRSNDVIEPMIKPQWYVNCNGIAKEALDVVMDENNKKIDILPKQYAAEWKRWLENICDWCVSRQLWWGHRVPARYVTLEDDKLKELGAYMDHWVVARDEKEAEAEARKVFSGKKFELVQDPDVLDTWFSSGLFPLSVLGWPDDTQDLKTFYPTAVLETGHDILFFWVAAMVMLEMIFGGDVPFQKYVVFDLFPAFIPISSRAPETPVQLHLMPSVSPPRSTARRNPYTDPENHIWSPQYTYVDKPETPAINPSYIPIPKRSRLPFTPSNDPVLDNSERELQAKAKRLARFRDEKICVQSKKEQRERKGDLDQYEHLDGDRNQTTESLAVKKYTRTAEREAALIRPMAILKKTMEYLLNLLDQAYDDRFLGLYNFLWDRMRERDFLISIASQMSRPNLGSDERVVQLPVQVKLMDERNMKLLDLSLAALSTRCSKDLELNLAKSLLCEMGQCTTVYPYNQLFGALVLKNYEMQDATLLSWNLIATTKANESSSHSGVANDKSDTYMTDFDDFFSCEFTTGGKSELQSYLEEPKLPRTGSMHPDIEVLCKQTLTMKIGDVNEDESDVPSAPSIQTQQSGLG